MSVSGGKETHRSHLELNIPLGGTSTDAGRVTATEDRVLKKVALDDRGGSANVQIEVSFSSAAVISSGDDDDARSSVIAIGGSGQVIDGLNITWSAGEEIHLHGANNSGADERVAAVFYYEEA